jgi:dipeptidase
MSSDMMVALDRACVHGNTLFGLNHHAEEGAPLWLRRFEGAAHSLEEKIPLSHLTLPQARQTWTVLGQQPEGSWGLTHGLNEHQVAIGVTGWQSRLPRTESGLTGCELVRLALERGQSALQAVDALTDLVSRHGQCGAGGAAAPDHIFAIADPHEAYVVETAGRYWALLECRHTRASTGVALTRQDWRRLAPGLAELAFARGWWPDDGSKLDFAGCLDSQAASHALARRRWGRASVALAQQAGAIDPTIFRLLLEEQYENNRALVPDGAAPLAGSFIGVLRARQAPLAWFSFGAPAVALYFPLCPLGDLPAAFGPPVHPASLSIPHWTRQFTARLRAGQFDAKTLNEALEQLQATFDRDAEEFVRQTESLKQQARAAEVRGLATALMQRHAQLFEQQWRRLTEDRALAEAMDGAEHEELTAAF